MFVEELDKYSNVIYDFTNEDDVSYEYALEDLFFKSW